MKHRFSVGDKAICDSKVVTVQQVKDGRVTDVCFGYGTMGGHDLPCTPITPAGAEAIRIADKFRESWGDVRVNYPSISHRVAELVAHAAETGDTRPLKAFGQLLDHALRQLKEMTVEDIPVLLDRSH